MQGSKNSNFEKFTKNNRYYDDYERNDRNRNKNLSKMQKRNLDKREKLFSKNEERDF